MCQVRGDRMTGQRIDANLAEPLSPVEIEQRLRQSITLITNAQTALRNARDRETEAELAYKGKLWRATLDPAAPRPGRGSGDATVGERDAWVSLQAQTEWEAYRRAEVTREAAQDHLRTVLAVVEVLRSLGASVRTAYEGAGYDSGRGQR